MRKLVSFLVIVSMLAVLIPLPTEAALAMHTSLSSADAKIDNFANGGQFGGSAAIVGDVNGDGFDDYMVVDRMNGTSGDAYLFWGRASGFPTSASQANVTFYSESKTEAIWTVARLGDVNGDGIDDIIIGAPTMDKPTSLCGAAYIFFGKHNGWNKFTNLSQAGAIIRGTQMMDEIGQVMAGVGDFNADGFDDIVLGTVSKSGGGWAYLFLGKHFGSPAWNTSMNLTHAAASWHGKDTYSRAGYSIDGGDVNGDGYDDIVVGAPGSDWPPDNYKSPGYTYILFGRKGTVGTNLDISAVANASLKGEHYDDYTGVSVAVLGDVNRDGFEDIITASTNNDEAGNSAGKAYLVFGHASGWTLDFNLSGSDASWLGEAANNEAGKIVAKAGDVNGDGYNDILIAAPNNSDQTLTAQGQTYLILGKKNGWANNVALNNADASWLGETNSDGTPDALSGAGDINGDIVHDLLFGSTRSSSPSRAYLVFPVKNKRPTALNISKVELFLDAAMTQKASYAKTGDQIWVRLKALDADPTVVNAEKVSITNWPQDFGGFDLIVTETGTNTGIFTSDFYLENMTQPDLRWIKATPISRVRVESVTNHTAFDEISVGGGIKMDSLTLLPAAGNPVLFAMKMSYSIRVNISDTLGHDHIDFVNLSFPLSVGHINFTWTHATNKFSKTYDPNFYMILDGASFSDDPSMNRSVVTFRVFFNWTFPDELYHSIVATVGSKGQTYVTKGLTDAYRVENDLDFKGTLKVQNQKGKYLIARDSLLPSEILTFTGVIVVYQGTTDSYPPNTAFDVVINDTDNRSWVGQKSSGAYIYIKANATPESNLYDNFTVSIMGMPAVNVNKTLKISFKVDGVPVTFSDPSPSSVEWQTNKRVMARVNISDGLGSGVNANSIEYRTKPNGGVWGLWKNAELTGVSPQITASALVDVTDGPANEIQWRANDAVGNPPGNKTESPVYIIRVDTVAPTFSNLWPGTGNQSKTANVVFGVRIQDPWSFVNGSTVEYTVSLNDQVDWSSWAKANYSGILTLFDCKTNFTFLNGSKNWVRWRAADSRGNLAMSDPLQISVNLTPPKPPNRKPLVPAVPDKTVNVGSTLIFTVNATDPDGDTKTFSLTDNPEGMSITPLGLLTFSPTREQSGVHNVTVMVSDGKLNTTTSFKVTVVLLRPTAALNNPALLQKDLKGKVTLTGSASGGVQGIAKVEYCVDAGAFAPTTGTTSWSLVLKTTDLKNGKHNLTVKVTDGLGTTNSVNYDFTVKNKGKTGGGMGAILPIILAVVVIVVVLAIVGAVLMMKKKKKPEPATPAEAQTAAQASAAYNPAPQQPQQPSS
jgi:hypothetical protein